MHVQKLMVLSKTGGSKTENNRSQYTIILRTVPFLRAFTLVDRPLSKTVHFRRPFSLLD